MSEPYEELARALAEANLLAHKPCRECRSALGRVFEPRLERAARQIADKIDQVKMPCVSEILQILRETIGK